ncbi:hypothetical protein [Vogesella sp. LIG4]|uniref:hypothetical protein n=1 Tax=Vogesella sp. LIG4 TaxID=1192162 RepID=UPI00082017BC|nr:hypothetical protein [Vogesella sp. LIG4]SCK12559.1 hypothetical protein PSELUDRAFT_1134 [Vogesella sp. LIG4]
MTFPAKSLIASCAVLLSACATQAPLQPFTTDGCSLFPDRALIGKADWCTCCVAHDLAYWRGGSAEQRLQADQALRRCVLAASGSRELAELMFTGVHLGGGPYFFTPYRWGYGWRYGRGYRKLSEGEQAQADALLAQQQPGPPAQCPLPR